VDPDDENETPGDKYGYVLVELVLKLIDVMWREHDNLLARELPAEHNQELSRAGRSVSPERLHRKHLPLAR